MFTSICYFVGHENIIMIGKKCYLSPKPASTSPPHPNAKHDIMGINGHLSPY